MTQDKHIWDIRAVKTACHEKIITGNTNTSKYSILLSYRLCKNQDFRDEGVSGPSKRVIST